MRNLQKQVNFETTDRFIQAIKSNHLENRIILGGALADDLLGYKGLVGVNKAYNECSKGRLLYIKDTMYKNENILYINDNDQESKRVLSDLSDVIGCYDIENNVPQYLNIINVGGVNCVDRLSNEMAIVNTIAKRINSILSNATHIDWMLVFSDCIAEEMYIDFRDLVWLLYNYKHKFNGSLAKLKLYINSIIENSEIILDAAIKDIDMYERFIESFCIEVKSERYKELKVFIDFIHGCQAVRLRDVNTDCTIMLENFSQYSDNIQQELMAITANSIGTVSEDKKSQTYLATIYGLVRYNDKSIIVSPIDGYKEILTRLYGNSKKLIIELVGRRSNYKKLARVAISRNKIYGK